MTDITETAAEPTTDAAGATEPQDTGTTASPPPSVVERLRARAAERQSKEDAQSAAAELAELRALKAAVEAGRYKQFDPEAVERDMVQRFAQDPLSIMRKHQLDAASQREVLRRLTQGVLNPDAASLRAELDELKRQPKEQSADPRSIAEQVQQALQAQRDRQEVEDAFDAMCSETSGDGEGAAAKRPMSARKSRAARIALGDQIADEFAAQGIEFTLEDLADALEERLVEQYRDATGEDPPHLRPQAGTTSTKTTGAASRAGSRAATAVLTNEIAAGGTARAPSSKEERERAAEAELRALFA